MKFVLPHYLAGEVFSPFWYSASLVLVCSVWNPSIQSRGLEFDLSILNSVGHIRRQARELGIWISFKRDSLNGFFGQVSVMHSQRASFEMFEYSCSVSVRRWKVPFSSGSPLLESTASCALQIVGWSEIIYAHRAVWICKLFEPFELFELWSETCYRMRLRHCQTGGGSPLD